MGDSQSISLLSYCIDESKMSGESVDRVNAYLRNYTDNFIDIDDNNGL